LLNKDPAGRMGADQAAAHLRHVVRMPASELARWSGAPVARPSQPCPEVTREFAIMGAAVA